MTKSTGRSLDHELFAVVDQRLSYQTWSYSWPFNAIQHYRIGGTDQTLSHFTSDDQSKKWHPLVGNCTTQFRVYTTYLLDKANVSIEYDCYPSLSTNLPVTIEDMNENVIIPAFSVRSGIDQNNPYWTLIGKFLGHQLNRFLENSSKTKHFVGKIRSE